MERLHQYLAWKEAFNYASIQPSIRLRFYVYNDAYTLNTINIGIFLAPRSNAVQMLK